MTKDYAKYRGIHHRNIHRPPLGAGTSSYQRLSAIPKIYLMIALLLLLGLTSLFLLWPRKNNLADQHTLSISMETPAATTPAPSAKSKPRFDFYTLLPNMSVATTERAAPPPPAQSDRPVNQPADQAPEIRLAQKASPNQNNFSSSTHPNTHTHQEKLQEKFEEKFQEKPQKNRATQDKGIESAFMVQAASFKDPLEAEKLKAKLALMGLESQIETNASQNGSVWHRVLIGPITTQAEAKEIQTNLEIAENLDSLLLRVRV